MLNEQAAGLEETMSEDVRAAALRLIESYEHMLMGGAHLPDDVVIVAAYALAAAEQTARLEAENERLKLALRSLWDVTIVGHARGDTCPYRVGHSSTEHVVWGHRVMSLDAWVTTAHPPTAPEEGPDDGER